MRLHVVGRAGSEQLSSVLGGYGTVRYRSNEYGFSYWCGYGSHPHRVRDLSTDRVSDMRIFDVLPDSFDRVTGSVRPGHSLRTTGSQPPLYESRPEPPEYIPQHHQHTTSCPSCRSWSFLISTHQFVVLTGRWRSMVALPWVSSVITGPALASL